MRTVCTLLAITIGGATAGLSAAVTHHHRRPVAASEQRPDALRVSRGIERQPLLGVHAAFPSVKARHHPVPSRVARPAPGSGLHDWSAVAQCESSGDWHINTGNGYYGGLQEDATFWRTYGGLRYAARPDLATRQQQVTVAERGLAVQGLRAWPSCGRYL